MSNISPSPQIMSYCKEEGKDRIIFVTKEDEQKDRIELKENEDDEEEAGLINQDGSINWACPCLGGMATGPCGYEFREAFGCFHHSTEDPKGSDCYEAFKSMQDCMSKYPDLYDHDNKDGGDDDNGESLESIAERAEQEAAQIQQNTDEKSDGVGS